MSTPSKLIRISEVSNITTLAKSTIWAKVANGAFPKPIKLGANVSAWRESDIAAWIDNLANQ
jgi:prophage regulatory protein